MERRGIAIVTFLLVSVVFFSGWMQKEEPTWYVLQPESRIWIEGTSTIHDWTCEVNEVAGLIETAPHAGETLSLGRVEVSVPVEAIECKKKTMNKKTRKALKATEHPHIQYVLEQATVLSVSDEGGFELETSGRLTMAGAENTIDMTVTGVPLPDGGFRFTGSAPLLQTDFGIKPPTAVLGTIKTGDRVVVHFDVVAAPRQNERETSSAPGEF
ncbi:MAG: YceI family protein [Rhodothermales bacterium]